MGRDPRAGQHVSLWPMNNRMTAATPWRRCRGEFLLDILEMAPVATKEIQVGGYSAWATSPGT